jgi:hypothetical protein
LICAVQITAGASKHACVVVRDANKQVLPYVYFGRRAAAKLLTRNEAPAHHGEYRQAARFAATPPAS